MIPILDLKAQYESLKPEIDRAILEVVASGQYILGPNVKALEREIAAYCDCARGIGVANGTDAIHLVLRALRIGPGDEVITPPSLLSQRLRLSGSWAPSRSSSTSCLGRSTSIRA